MRQPRKSSTKKPPKKLGHINQRYFAHSFPRLSTLSVKAGGSPYEKPLYSSSGRKKKPCQSHDLNPPFNDTTRRGNEGANTADINMSFSIFPAPSPEPQGTWDQPNIYRQYPMDPRATRAIELGDGHYENPAWNAISIQGLGYNLQDQVLQMSIDYGPSSVWQRYQHDNLALWEVESNDGMFGVQHHPSISEAAMNNQWYPDHNHQVNEYWATSSVVSSDSSTIGNSYFTPTPFLGFGNNCFSYE